MMDFYLRRTLSEGARLQLIFPALYSGRMDFKSSLHPAGAVSAVPIIRFYNGNESSQSSLLYFIFKAACLKMEFVLLLFDYSLKIHSKIRKFTLEMSKDYWLNSDIVINSVFTIFTGESESIQINKQFLKKLLKTDFPLPAFVAGSLIHRRKV